MMGILFPRDAMDQWRVCDLRDSESLQVGDFVVFTKPDQERVHHLLVILNEQESIESRGSKGRVLVEPWRARCSLLDGRVASGEVIAEERLGFGTPSMNKLLAMSTEMHSSTVASKPV
jgi:cell wall-associated NlpC family hydrolase